MSAREKMLRASAFGLISVCILGGLSGCTEAVQRGGGVLFPSIGARDIQAEAVAEELDPATRDANRTLAERFAPELLFDQVMPTGRGPQSKCLPESAEGYYLARKKGFKGRICNQDESALAAAPAYYEVSHVSDSAFITYWFFYGYQSTCFSGAGAHDSDWERITVRVQGDAMHEVVFFQHNGRYTRSADSIRREGEHPVVYVGKNSHGSYHDAGGGGGCGYFSDYRNPGTKNLHWETWRTLRSIADGDETWMHSTAADDALWQGPTPPTRRRPTIDERVCKGRAGVLRIGPVTLSSTNTCKRSDYRDERMTLRDLATQPTAVATRTPTASGGGSGGGANGAASKSAP